MLLPTGARNIFYRNDTTNKSFKSCYSYTELLINFDYVFEANVEHNATFVTSSDADRELEFLTQNIFYLFTTRRDMHNDATERKQLPEPEIVMCDY